MSTTLRFLTQRLALNLPINTQSRIVTTRNFSSYLYKTPTRPQAVPAPVLSVRGRPYATEGISGSKKNPFPVLPILAIFIGGSGLFYLLVQTRKVEDKSKKPQATAPVTTTMKPTFSEELVSVIFVLGGPGAGKGTQCQNLVRDYGFVHLSAGDLLRAEQNRPGSDFGELIKTYIREGKIVPMEVTVALLENAMKEAIEKEKKHKFLIDGFPRQMDQALKFEEDVCPSKLVLFFDCPEDVMEKRLLTRGQTSGRIDDNIESIRKRFRTFLETSYPVVEYYDKLGKVVKVDATDVPEGVYAKVKKELAQHTL